MERPIRRLSKFQSGRAGTTRGTGAVWFSCDLVVVAAGEGEVVAMLAVWVRADFPEDIKWTAGIAVDGEEDLMTGAGVGDGLMMGAAAATVAAVVMGERFPMV